MGYSVIRKLFMLLETVNGITAFGRSKQYRWVAEDRSIDQTNHP